MRSSSFATHTSSDVVRNNVTLRTAQVSVDSASDEELLCKSDEDNKVERDGDTDSQGDDAVNGFTPGDTCVTAKSSSELQQLGMARFISDNVR